MGAELTGTAENQLNLTVHLSLFGYCSATVIQYELKKAVHVQDQFEFDFFEPSIPHLFRTM